MKFTYSSGQRVLDGYVLKRGIGRGGFGEVYYAVSDGGKEVALKLLRGNTPDVELRGMAQCLNLKHPNLLTLYDLRTDPQGEQWVIMEYIAGEPLGVVLNRHPHGLPPHLARRYASMGDMARALEAVAPDAATRRAGDGARKPDPGAPAPRRPGAPSGAPRPEPILEALPAVSFKGLVGELCGSLALTALFA